MMSSVLDDLSLNRAASRDDRPPTAVVPAIDARDLWFSYAGGRLVLRGVSASAAHGRITMILGASGGGKTTLLKLLKGLIAPQRGEISVLGRPLIAAPGKGKLDRRVAYIPQQLGLVRSMTVLDNVLTGALGRVGTLASLVKLWPKDTVAQAHETLAVLGIGHKARDKVYALSGGERQRVAIARALMQGPAVILADEFVSQLDPVTTVEIMEAMRGIAGRGVALLMTTHELDVVERFADRVLVLRDGEKVLDCPAAEAGAGDLSALLK
jgi:phosphonate transport system ATP-binding protein